jgi:hypothetical protein
MLRHIEKELTRRIKIYGAKTDSRRARRNAPARLVTVNAGQLHYAFTSSSTILAFLSWESETDLSPTQGNFRAGEQRALLL